MRVERLEVFGFKSFMERLVLPLEQGITGVVGPNGCGKSNIIDALRWVLGESRASQLRGGVLEDVIFNGTESLRPLGLAEVSVVIRSDKQSIYEDLLSYYESVEGGVYEATTRGSTAEAQDELAAETAQASESREGEILAAPENSDQLPAEGPESTGPAAEGEVASEALQAGTLAEGEVESPASDFISDIKASLSKYSWLNSVSEVQITRRLYRSGESEFFINKVPCRLKDIKELFRVVGLAARGYTIIAQGEIGRIITAKPDDRRMVIEEAAHIAGFRENMNAVSKRIVDTEGQLVRLDDVIKEVTRQVGSLKRQAARAASRAELKAELSVSERDLFRDTLGRLAKRIDDSARKSEGLVQEESAAQSALESIRAEEQKAREDSVRHDSEIEQLRQRADQAREEINKQNREVVARESRIREINSVVQARQAETRRLEDRRAMLNQRKVESRESFSRMEEAARALDTELAAIDLSGEDELKTLSVDLQQMREDQRGKDRTIRDMRDKLVSAQSRRDAIQSQMTAASPITHLKRALGGDGQLPAEVTGNCKLLVDGIRIPDRYTKALQSVLAERATFLVVDEVAQVARKFQELVLRADPQNKKGIGVGLFASVPDFDSGTPASSGVEGVEPLLSQVQTLEWSRGLVKRLLSKVWVATDLNSATAYLERLAAQGEPDPETVIVTESGDLLSPWSFYSLRHDGGVILMKSKIDEANRVIEENQGAYDQLVAQRDEIAGAIAEGEKRHGELVRSIQQGQARLREISNKQGQARGRLESEGRMLNQLEGDLQRIVPQMAEIQQQIGQYEESLQQATRDLEQLRQRDNSELERSLDEAITALRALEERRKLLRDSSSQMLRGVELKRQAFEAIRDRLMRERMAAERLRGELSSAESNIRERQGAEALQALMEEAQAAELLLEQARRELEAKVTGMRQRLDREGEVDPTVIEQFEAESKRLDDLTAQKEDLSKALEILRVTLAELQEACTRRFQSTFEAIRKNFAFFGPKLFGGGTAELSLSDISNPLEGGVDIVVRPPGKKPKSIDLLSGGEKALCAIALVFSMFMVRPSPICVLDEVDAPLDEANVHRFVAFIKEMSARTQFLMITHNKASMTAADTLVGVTMPQPGASRVISVSLKEAQSQVA